MQIQVYFLKWDLCLIYFFLLKKCVKTKYLLYLQNKTQFEEIIKDISANFTNIGNIYD